jgi:phosphatidylinositol alpha-mannosyltransferase
MRIALVAEDFYPQLGGVPEHVHHLALELLARGHQATVITSHMRGRCPANFRNQYPVIRVGKSVVIYLNGGVARITAGAKLERRLEAIIRQHRFDVVHVHGGLAPTFGILAPRAAHRAGVPVVNTFHSWFPPSATVWALRRPLQHILDLHAATIAVSEAAVEAHARYFMAEWEIIPNGVDVQHFHPHDRAPPTLGAREPRLLYLHRLEPRNHLDTLLDAMPEILAHYPDARLIIAGDGPWRRYYRRRARMLGDHVRFLGRIDDRPDQYRTADLYLCPTMRAGFGITLLEAMACGTPLVIADNPGFRWVVDGGREAVLLPHSDAHAWARTVVALLADPDRRAAMSAAGVAKAQRYAWPTIAERILGVYARVTSGGPRKDVGQRSG